MLSKSMDFSGLLLHFHATRQLMEVYFVLEIKSMNLGSMQIAEGSLFKL